MEARPPLRRGLLELFALERVAVRAPAPQFLIGDWVIPPRTRGQAGLGDGRPRHAAHTFIPDIGENLVHLGERDDALGRVWHLPSPETRTTREVVALVTRPPASL